MSVALKVGLVIAVAVLITGCSGATATPAAPTEAPPTQTAGAPASTPTAPPTTPTTAPTERPTVEPTATRPRETVTFTWAPGSVTPSDADDVADIVTDLRTHEGIRGGTGDETGIIITYDPTLITVEEIIAMLERIGHPVIQQ